MRVFVHGHRLKAAIADLSLLSIHFIAFNIVVMIDCDVEVVDDL